MIVVAVVSIRTRGGSAIVVVAVRVETIAGGRVKDEMLLDNLGGFIGRDIDDGAHVVEVARVASGVAAVDAVAAAVESRPVVVAVIVVAGSLTCNVVRTVVLEGRGGSPGGGWGLTPHVATATTTTAVVALA